MNRFKQWYSVNEAAALLARMSDEPVTERDVLDRVNSGELPAWFDAQGHYAVEVYPGCHYYADPRQNPLVKAVGIPQLAQLDLARQGPEDLLDGVDTVGVITGRHRLANPSAMEGFFVPVPGQEKAVTFFEHGLLVIDDDGETLLKIVRPIPDSNPSSLHVHDFVSYVVGPFPGGDIHIAAADLLAMASTPAPAVEVAPRERDTLLKQIGVLALLLLEESGSYRRGDKPNARQIGDAVAEIVAALPDANLHGLSAMNIRKNISEGLTLLRQ